MAERNESEGGGGAAGLTSLTQAQADRAAYTVDVVDA